MNNDPFGLKPQGPSATRLFVIFVLISSFMMVYNYFFGPQVNPENQEVAAAATQTAPAIMVAPSANSITQGYNLNAGQVLEFKVDLKKNLSDKEVGVIRGGYDAAIPLSGGQLSKFELTGYESSINLAQGLKNGLALFPIMVRDNSFALPVDAAYTVVNSSDLSLSIEHVTSDNINVLRHYIFDDKNFSLQHEIEFKNNDTKPRTLSFDLVMAEGGLKPQASSFLAPSPSDFGIVCHHGGKKERLTFEELKEKTYAFAGPVEYFAFDKQYFLVATALKSAEQGRGVSVSVTGSDKDEAGFGVSMSLQHEPITLAVGESKSVQFVSYLGPKQLDLLKAAGHDLEENINFGWFGVISRPMLWLLNQIYAFVGNFGWAIIILTLLLKALTFPLTQKSFVSMQQMKKYQPDIKALQKKFAHDKVQLSQKQMEFYKEKGINPMAGCLPMLIQMPIWFALYQMLYNSVELYQQPFFAWVQNLTAPDPYYILPAAMGISMFVQTMFQPAPEDQPQMKYVMYGMPFFLTFVMLKMPAGLALYMFVNNILTIFQQIYIKRKYANT